MPVERLFSIEGEKKPSSLTEEEIGVEGQLFRLTYIIEPHNRSSVAIKERIHTMLDGKCLGITEADVTANISSGSYSIVTEITNLTTPSDGAICTGQYADWCAGSAGGGAQLWLNDVCRISSLSKEDRRAVISPVKVLLQEIERIVRDKARLPVEGLWLNVDKDGVGHDILIGIYSGYGYGTVSPEVCASTAGNYTVMYKPLGGANNGNIAMAGAGTGGARRGQRRRTARRQKKQRV